MSDKIPLMQWDYDPNSGKMAQRHASMDEVVNMLRAPNEISERIQGNQAVRATLSGPANTPELKVFVRGRDEPISINLPNADRVNNALKNPDLIKGYVDKKYSEYRNVIDTISQGMTPLQKAALIGGQIPISGDIAGLLADMEMYIQDPESRTMFNGFLTMLGAIPFLPNASSARVASNAESFKKRIDRLKKAGVDTNQRWFHASTHDIKEWDNVDLQNPESHFGAATYLTDDAHDASKNYGNLEGPDLTQRVQGRAEQIANEAGWDYDDPRALKQAQQELVGDNLGVVYPVYTKTEKPFDISSEGDAFLRYEQPEYDPKDFLDEAGGDMDEAIELAQQESWNHEPEGELVDFFESLRWNPQTEDGIHELIRSIQERAMDYGGISGKDLDEVMRASNWYAYGDMGEFSNNEVYRQALQDAGFDSIIHDGDIFQGMDIPAGTRHQIIFNPENIHGQFSGGRN